MQKYPKWFGLNEETVEFIKNLPESERPKAKRLMGIAEREKCRQDIFYWLDHTKHIKTEKYPDGLPYVFTHDPHQAYVCRVCEKPAITHTFSKLQTHLRVHHNQETRNIHEALQFFEELPSIRPFPIHLPYIKPIVEVWLKEPYLLIPKSRDMTATWLVVMMYTWDTLYNEGAQNVFQSLNARKAFDLVSRAYTIYSHQPKILKDLAPARIVQGSMKGGELVVPKINSIIMGFPQEPDQIRQYHPRGLFQDEAAFLPSAAASFAAAKPSIQNGGRFTAISSANPGWFQACVEDTLEVYNE